MDQTTLSRKSPDTRKEEKLSDAIASTPQTPIHDEAKTTM